MTQEEIKNFIPRISTNLDFVTLLNMIKKDLYGEKCHTFSLKIVMYYCNPDRAVDAYKKFRIPKKSGGFREISAPRRSLLQIQRCLNIVFQALYEPSSIATGFLPGKSIVDGATRHIGANYVFNTDIKDFFPSINKGRVYRLLTLERYGFRPKIALMVAGLCCMKVCTIDTKTGEPVVDYVLPQGSPASPILTNMVCEKLDRRLAGLAKRFKVRCSRYADDITFSSQHNVYSKNGVFRKELQRILEDQHFRMNEPKTRLQRKNERQEVTGVVVNDRINVNRQYVRDLQSILFIWGHYGYDTAFARFSKHYREEKPNNKFGGEGFMENVIHGKLMYMKMVKGEDDPVYQRLSAKFDALFRPKAGKAKNGDEYELVYTIEQFEKQFDTTVEFKIVSQPVSLPCDTSQSESQSKSAAKRVYATSRFNGRNIYIVVSKNCQETITKMLSEVSDNILDKPGTGTIPLELSGTKKSGVYNNDFKKKFCVVLMRKNSRRTCWMIMKSNPRMVANTISMDEYLKIIGKTDQIEILKGAKVTLRRKTGLEYIHNNGGTMNVGQKAVLDSAMESDLVKPEHKASLLELLSEGGAITLEYKKELEKSMQDAIVGRGYIDEEGLEHESHKVNCQDYSSSDNVNNDNKLLSESHSDQHLSDNCTTSVQPANESSICQQSLNDVLKQFIDSKYDFRILEQWDKTKNS